MAERSLRKLHDCGFTTFSGMPVVRYLGFKDGKPQFDFTRGRRADGACPAVRIHDAGRHVHASSAG